MNKYIIASLLLCGCCLAMPQGPQPEPQGADNPFVRILQLESYQNGADFGHTLQQEDGTAAGQKIGPDGLTYGFYSYIQPDGNRVKVYYRAGQGVGYEVLKVEGLDTATLGNLRHLGTGTPEEPKPRAQSNFAPIPQAVRQPPPRRTPAARPAPRFQAARPAARPAPQPAAPSFPAVPQFPAGFSPAQAQAPVHAPAPAADPANPFAALLAQAQSQSRQAPRPAPRAPAASLAPLAPEPEPHRFDYPANLNLERTGLGFISSFKAL